MTIYEYRIPGILQESCDEFYNHDIVVFGLDVVEAIDRALVEMQELGPDWVPDDERPVQGPAPATPLCHECERERADTVIMNEPLCKPCARDMYGD